MSDQTRIGIFAVAAVLLLGGALVATRIDSSKPILNQITQIISSAPAPSQPAQVVNTIITQPQPSHSVSASPSWVKNSTTSASWKDLVAKDVSFGGECSIASTTLSIKDTGGKASPVTFEYASCPDDSDIPSLYKIIDNTIKGGSKTIASFWILGDKKPIDIISSLIDSLPSAYERKSCLIVETGKSSQKIPQYKVIPNDPTVSCGQYGLTVNNRFFQQAGNVLLFVTTSNEIPTFDPNSFR